MIKTKYYYMVNYQATEILGNRSNTIMGAEDLSTKKPIKSVDDIYSEMLAYLSNKKGKKIRGDEFAILGIHLLHKETTIAGIPVSFKATVIISILSLLLILIGE